MPALPGTHINTHAHDESIPIQTPHHAVPQSMLTAVHAAYNTMPCLGGKAPRMCFQVAAHMTDIAAGHTAPYGFRSQWPHFTGLLAIATQLQGHVLPNILLLLLLHRRTGLPAMQGVLRAGSTHGLAVARYVLRTAIMANHTAQLAALWCVCVGGVNCISYWESRCLLFVTVWSNTLPTRWMTTPSNQDNPVTLMTSWHL